MVYGVLTRSDGTINSTCRSCTRGRSQAAWQLYCHLSYGRIFSQSPSETVAGAVHVLNHRTRNWFTGNCCETCGELTARGEMWRGGVGGEACNRHRFLWQPPLRPRQQTSCSAEAQREKKKRVGYWWLWRQHLAPSKRALMHCVIISNLQFVHPSPFFLLLTLLLSRNKKKSLFPRIPCSSLLPPTVCHICHCPPNNNRPQQISSLLSHFLSVCPFWVSFYCA